MKQQEQKLLKAGIPVFKIKNILKKQFKNAKPSDFPKSQDFIIQTIKNFHLKDIPKSILILLIVLILNTIGLILIINIISTITSFSDFRSALLGSALGAILIAPIVEEIAKKISIQLGIGATYISVFSWTEALLYVVSNPITFVGRIIAVLFHHFTFFVQGANTSIDKDGKAIVSKTGLAVGVLMHACWNLLATLPILVISLSGTDSEIFQILKGPA